MKLERWSVGWVLGLVLIQGCGGSGSAPSAGSHPSYSAVAVTNSTVVSSTLAINDSGTVIGTIQGAGVEPFYWTQLTGIQALPVPASCSSASPYQINSSGMVIGNGTTTSGLNRGIVWTANVPKDIGDLGGGQTWLYGVSAGGEVVGTSTDSSGILHPIQWTSTFGISDLSGQIGQGSTPYAVNDQGMIVGQSAQGIAFEYFSGTGLHSIGAFNSQSSLASAVNNAGQVVGSAYTGIADQHIGFYWTATGGGQLLGNSPAGSIRWTAPSAINASGTVVGGDPTSSSGNPAFIWTRSAGLKALGPATSGLPNGVTLLDAAGINASGEIAALGSDGNAYLLIPAGQAEPGIARKAP